MRRFALNSLALACCAFVPFALGCTTETKTITVDPSATTGGHDHDHAHDHGEHAHEGPHGGHVIELGEEEYHAELAHDDKTDLVALYVMDGAMKAAVPIEAKEVTIHLLVAGKEPLQVVLPAKPLEGETDGKSSRFEAENLELQLAIDDPKTTGHVNLSIGGKDFVGKIEGHAHEHGHAHK